MIKFDTRAAASYVAATAVALISTTMLFAATAIPQVVHASGLVA